MKKLSFALVFALSTLFVQSCQKDSLNDPVIDPYAGREAPKLPSEESFVMPFTAFSGYNSTEMDSRSPHNWAYSAANVFVWNTILTFQLAIPVLSFYESFNHEPVYQGSGVWLWAYEITEDGETYRAELYGELLVNDEVKWDMFVSQVGGFSQLHWYTGITAIDESYAHWTLNFDEDNPGPIMSIDYQRDNGNGVEIIRYTNIIPNVPENGGYIEYREGNGAGGDFDRAYDIYKAEIDNMTEINWDNVHNNGRVKDADQYQDEEWHCWDTNLQDTDC